MIESPAVTPIVFSIPGYQILDCLEENIGYSLYRAMRLTDRRLVVLKYFKETPTATFGTHPLHYEAELSQQFNIPGIPLVLGFEPVSKDDRFNTPILVLENLVGKSLRQILQHQRDRFSIEQLLEFMITGVEILGRLHEQGLIHRNLSPKHIFWDVDSQQVHMINIGLMPLLEFSKPSSGLRETLPYISPEQTERLKRTVDYRSDFYSIGIIFYELLTGTCPFVSSDPMELIHHHLARQPMPPHALNSQIPIGLSSIVMRLLAKTPEERYQSAHGLRYDLKHCLQDWKENAQISMFALGRVDRASQLNLTRQTYGRETDLDRLFQQLDRTRQGHLQMTLICGEAGVGKSFLVQELQNKVAISAGYFIVGQCDDLHPELPDKPLIQALRQLVQQVLTESDDRIVQWRDRLKAALGNLGQVLVEVIPDLALILGPCSAVPKLDPTESQHRFYFVVQSFLRAFAQPDAPLVIVLEDLHWSDGTIFKLLATLLAGLQDHALYWVGTYRTQGPQNLSAIVEPLQTHLSEFSPEILVLQPLTPLETQQMIADVLGAEAEKVQDLAAVVFQRSQGNPFFIHQLLTFLQSERLLIFEFEAGEWRWDLSTILDRGLTDDVVDLMVEKIRRLSPELQQVLQIAACVGQEFELEVVAQLSQRSTRWVAQQLNQAMRHGLILPAHPRSGLVRQLFRFLHDKLQQAAYSLMSSTDRQYMHWQAGQIGLRSMLESRQEDLLFEVVHQLNAGREQRLSEEDAWQLSHLNFGAAKKAKASAAYDLSLQHCEIGLALLEDLPNLQDSETLVFELMKERAECQYLCGNLEQAEQEFEQLTQRCKTREAEAELYVIQMVLCLTHSQQQEAIALGLRGLSLLGVELLQPITVDNATTALADVKQLLQTQSITPHQSIDRLSELPPLRSSLQLAILRLLQYLAAASVTIDRPLYQVVIAQMVKLSLEYGNSIYSPYAYVAYGTILSASLEDYALGYALGRAALREVTLRGSLRSQAPDSATIQSLMGVTQFSFWGLLAHWHEPFRICRAQLQSAFRACCETGEFLYALYIQVVMGDAALIGGTPLLEVSHQLQQFQQFAQQRQHQGLQQDAEIKLRFVQALQGESLALSQLTVSTNPSESRSIDNNFESALVQSLQSNPTTLSRYYIYQLQLLYLLQDYEAAQAIAEISETLVACHYGTAIVVEHYFYQALTISTLGLNQSTDLTPELRLQFDRNLSSFKAWAMLCPNNFQARYELLQAEQAALENRDSDAMTLYDHAIQTAHQFKNTPIAAVASERAASYYQRSDRSRLALYALKDAYLSYQTWGATQKVQQLRSQLTQLSADPQPSLPAALLVSDLPPRLTQKGNSPSFVDTAPASQPSTFPSNLDWMTILKVSHTLSSEIVFSSLMEKLMRIVIENAGAQRGLLVQRRHDRWHIEAFGRVEQDRIEINTHLDTATPEHLPFSLLSYVERTHQTVVLDHAARSQQFSGDSYIRHYGTKSVLCFPILSQGKLSSILYLENNLAIGAFTDDRLEVLQLLTAQVVISMENARLYSDLQGYVQEVETKNQALKLSQSQLETQTEQLRQAFERLQDTQAQLVQTEKMSSLGQLVAGVAHEIKNPLNFISGNLDYAHSYVQQLMSVIGIYQEQAIDLPPAIVYQIEQLDLPFIQTDLAKLLQSMSLGTERIEHLIRSLQNFSRPGESEPEFTQLHEGIESTLLILQPRFKATQFRPEITLKKHYGDLPQIRCFPGEINQVFMNLIANAIDAIDERCEQFSFNENQAEGDQIIITTEVQANQVWISVTDSGIGLTSEACQEVFKTFYTTKPVGKGTGLGLSISAQIITDHHQGELTCRALDGDRGAEFKIALPIDLMNP